MLFMNHRKSKRRTALEQVQALLLEADEKCKLKDQELLQLRQQQQLLHEQQNNAYSVYEQGLLTPSQSMLIDSATTTASIGGTTTSSGSTTMDTIVSNNNGQAQESSITGLATPPGGIRTRNMVNDQGLLLSSVSTITVPTVSSKKHVVISPDNEEKNNNSLRTTHMDSLNDSDLSINKTSFTPVLPNTIGTSTKPPGSSSSNAALLPSHTPVTGNKRPRGGRGQRLDLTTSTTNESPTLNGENNITASNNSNSNNTNNVRGTKQSRTTPNIPSAMFSSPEKDALLDEAMVLNDTLLPTLIQYEDKEIPNTLDDAHFAEEEEESDCVLLSVHNANRPPNSIESQLSKLTLQAIETTLPMLLTPAPSDYMHISRLNPALRALPRPHVRVLAIVGGGNGLENVLHVPITTLQGHVLPVVVHAYSGLRDALSSSLDALNRGTIRDAQAAAQGLFGFGRTFRPLTSSYDNNNNSSSLVSSSLSSGRTTPLQGQGSNSGAISAHTTTTGTVSNIAGNDNITVSPSSTIYQPSTTLYNNGISSHLTCYPDLFSPRARRTGTGGTTTTSSASVNTNTMTSLVASPSIDTANTKVSDTLINHTITITSSSSATTTRPITKVLLQPYKEGSANQAIVTTVNDDNTSNDDSSITNILHTPLRVKEDSTNTASSTVSSLLPTTTTSTATTESSTTNLPQSTSLSNNLLVNNVSTTLSTITSSLPTLIPLSYQQHGYHAHTHTYGAYPVNAICLLPPCSGINMVSLPTIDVFAGPAAASLRARLLPHVPPYSPWNDPLFVRSRALFDPLVHYTRAAVGCLVLDTRAPVRLLLAMGRPSTTYGAFDHHTINIHRALTATNSSSLTSGSSTISSSNVSLLSLPVIRSKLIQEASALWIDCVTSLFMAQGCTPVSATGDVYNVMVTGTSVFDAGMLPNVKLPLNNNTINCGEHVLLTLELHCRDTEIINSNRYH